MTWAGVTWADVGLGDVARDAGMTSGSRERGRMLWERVLLRWGRVGCCGLGVALNFVHPLRAALRLHASPSRSEGEVLHSIVARCWVRIVCIVHTGIAERS